jgi:hypothetical protein
MATLIENMKSVVRTALRFRTSSSMLRSGRRLAATTLAMAMALTASSAFAQVATLTSGTPVFNPAVVGVATGSAQTINVQFNVTGYAGTFTPTAKLHYGLSYTMGAVSCSGGAAPETCTVPVTFQPLYPGARPDALLLMNGSAVLTTVLMNGVGQAPLALIQPGVVTQPPLAPANGYYYNSVVGEDGTAYVVSATSQSVSSVTSAGVVTVLPITGLFSPHSIAIDGAGTLYVAQNNYGTTLTTYTAAGVQGTLNVNPPAPFTGCQNSNHGALEYPFIVTAGLTGDLYVFEDLCQQILRFAPDDSLVSSPTLNPLFPGPAQMIVDSSGNLFIAGYAINEITPGGVQTQINTVGSTDGIAVDAADTLYATRYTGSNGVAELPATNYSTLESAIDTGAPAPLGVGLGGDGTVYVGNYTQLDKVDRSQGAIDFGEQPATGVTSAPQTVQVYNGGNQPLTLTSFGITGDGFALQASASSPCSSGLIIAPGALCNIDVTFTASHVGNSTGNVTITTNSLNGVGVVEQVALSGNIRGIYVIANPSPLNFGYQAPGTTTNPALAIQLTNNGALISAALGTVTTNNPAFQYAGTNCAAELAPGGTCSIFMTFSPTVAQAYAGIISVAEGGGSGPNQTVNIGVNGTGIPPIPIVNLNTTTLAFGDITVGSTSSPQSVTITNTGGATLNPLNIAVSADYSIYVPGTTCGVSLAAGASCNVAVQFNPAASGSANGMLTFTDNAIPPQQSVSLTGNGTMLSTAVGLATSSASSIYGSSITFTATVTVPSFPALNPTGTVNFYDGGTLLGSQALAAGKATFNTSLLNAGSHTLYTVYQGSPEFTTATSGNVTVNITQATLTVTANNVSKTVGAVNPAFTETPSGFVGVDTSAVLSGSAAFSTTATTTSAAGTYPIKVTQGTLAAANYKFTFVNGTLSVVAPPFVTITTTATVSAIFSGYKAVITVTNNGNIAANNVTLTTAILGTAGGTPLPQNIGTLAAGASNTITVTFPEASVGPPGLGVPEKYEGTYTGGSFGASIRTVILP